MDGKFQCNRCGATCRHDHEGNGCHACGSGTMHFVPDNTAPTYQMWPERRKPTSDDGDSA